MKESSKALLIGAEFLFVFALLLPALEVVVWDKPQNFAGWQAFGVALMALTEVFAHPSGFPVVGAGLGNFLFLVAPWLFLKRSPDSNAFGLLRELVIVALILALWSPHAGYVESPKLLAGYYAWILAYFTLFASVVASRYASRQATAK